MAKRIVFTDPVKEAELDRLMALAAAAHKAASTADEAVSLHIQAEFSALFKGVKWEVIQWGGDLRLSPADNEAERRLMTMASIAMNLGYHSAFFLHANGVYIDGRVDDGQFTIKLGLHAKSDELEASFRELEIDVDLRVFIQQAAKEELERAFQAMEAATQKHATLASYLAALESAGVPEVTKPLDPRTFYATTFTVEILHQEPLPEDMDLKAAMAEAETGSYSGDVLRQDTAEVDAKTMARLLQHQGSDPVIFGLTPEGRKLEE